MGVPGRRVPLSDVAGITYRGNLEHTRHGWLRLTPAYSVHLVNRLLDAIPDARTVLDPFCGTGTTALVCAERGLACHTADINPFLVWLARAKTRAYSHADIALFVEAGGEIPDAMRRGGALPHWTPSLHRIDRWWAADMLTCLSRARLHILGLDVPSTTRDLLLVAFCRLLIGTAKVTFGHQSLSFRNDGSGSQDPEQACTLWEHAVRSLAASAQSHIGAPPQVLQCDARELPHHFSPTRYDAVITSPPYPNRMSYVRELRPYMYWLGYLTRPGDAGELDWQAIGGTWGVATSRLGRWCPPASSTERVPAGLVDSIARHSTVLARYVHRYILDMAAHISGLSAVVRGGGTVHYVVGNSRFYDVAVPVEQVCAYLLEDAGFSHLRIDRLRKRTSGRDLWEYVVSARLPQTGEKVVGPAGFEPATRGL